MLLNRSAIDPNALSRSRGPIARDGVPRVVVELVHAEARRLLTIGHPELPGDRQAVLVSDLDDGLEQNAG